jgi:hypothetical protein
VAFIGFETESLHPYCEDDPAKVELSRFNAMGYLDVAFDYAFQTGQYWRFGDEEAQDVSEFIRGANPQANNGESSPLADPESLCRRAADTAFGRRKLQAGHNLTIHELALLGQMKEAAVRNSLSKERIAIERGEVDNAVAATWLRQRRDFIPTRTKEGHKERWVAHSRAPLLDRRTFSDAFVSILRGYEITAEQLAAKAVVSPKFVEALAQGEPGTDLEALQQVALALDLDVALTIAGGSRRAPPGNGRRWVQPARGRAPRTAFPEPITKRGQAAYLRQLVQPRSPSGELPGNALAPVL